MRRILAALAVASCLVASARAEIFGRWEYHDLGPHHLPYNFSIYEGQVLTADFSGLVGGWLDGVHTPHTFDVHTGELRELSPLHLGIRAVRGSQVLVGNGPTAFLYDQVSGESTTLPHSSIYDGGLNANGQVTLSETFNEHTGATSVVIWPTGERIDPPWVSEDLSTFGLPVGQLFATDLSDGGWATGWFEGAPTLEPGGWVANIETGEFHLLPFQSLAVNDLGQATDGISFWDGESTVPARMFEGGHPFSDGGGISPFVALNNHGQIVRALDIDDDGRILQLAPGPNVLIDPDPSTPPTEVPTWKLVVGMPLAIATDFDASGRVDQGDLDLILLNWGETFAAGEIPAGWVHDLPAGEIRIDQAELDEVLLRWGSADGTPAIAPLQTSAGGVPEPSSLWLLAVGLWLLALFTRHARRPGR